MGVLSFSAGGSPFCYNAYMESPNWVYILANAESKYYVGKAKNLVARLERHKTGVDRGYREYDLICFLPCESDAEARLVEKQVMGAVRANGFFTNYVWGYDKV